MEIFRTARLVGHSQKGRACVLFDQKRAYSNRFRAI